MSTKTDDARQKKLEQAMREGFQARRDGKAREDNGYDRKALSAAAELLMHDADDSKRARPYTGSEKRDWVEFRYEEGSFGLRSCWNDGYELADTVARTQGVERMMEIPLHTVRPTRPVMPRFADHPALFDAEEVPAVERRRLSKEQRERKRLAEWEGRTIATTLADEQDT